jgi:hypothetical protein
MNITCVNALAFIGGIGLAAMQSQSLPSDDGTMAESKMQQVVSAAATPSEEAINDLCGQRSTYNHATPTGTGTYSGR